MSSITVLIIKNKIGRFIRVCALLQSGSNLNHFEDPVSSITFPLLYYPYSYLKPSVLSNSCASCISRYR